ncbi:MAG: hypothetical protein NZ529_04690 [Cytophagaceae bacterium]|nr:hypothetical protein [Cytophagaceae bacterium]MDW8456073.1 hypothetical protein [Cytophagaceae bacterium]
MNIKTKILVRGVNNLSAARYCAGMQVEWISFKMSSRISMETIQAISGWISGVKLVCEVDENIKDSDDFIKASFDFYLYKHSAIPKAAENIISSIHTSDVLQIKNNSSSLYLLEGITSDDITTLSHQEKELLSKNSVIINIDNNDAEWVNVVLNTLNPFGIALQSPDEIKPGMLKSEGFTELIEQLTDVN